MAMVRMAMTTLPSVKFLEKGKQQASVGHIRNPEIIQLFVIRSKTRHGHDSLGCNICGYALLNTRYPAPDWLAELILIPAGCTSSYCYGRFR